MTDEIKIPEEIKEEAENLQELVEEEIGDAAEETIEVVEAEIVEDTPLDAAQEELEKVQERAQEIAAEVEDSEVMKIADKVEFTPEELAIIDKYAAAVDLKDTNSVLQFGADAQETDWLPNSRDSAQQKRDMAWPSFSTRLLIPSKR